MNIGEFSRNGKSRDREAKKAVDHDMNPDLKLVPYGILNILSGLLTIFMGTSFETSDFIVDCLEMWWENNRIAYSHIKELVPGSALLTSFSLSLPRHIHSWRVSVRKGYICNRPNVNKNETTFENSYL